MNKKQLITAALLPLLSAGAFGVLPVKEGEMAPNFSVKTIDGKTLSLASLRGKVVIVDFWTTT